MWARGDARVNALKLSIGLSEHRFSDVALEPVRGPCRSLFPGHLATGPSGDGGASKQALKLLVRERFDVGVAVCDLTLLTTVGSIPTTLIWPSSIIPPDRFEKA